MDNTDYSGSDAYEAALRDVETEIRAAFAAYFAGKPGVYVPAMTWRNSVDVEVGKKAPDAVDCAGDYEDTNAAFHAMLKGQVTLDALRAVLVERYIRHYAEDVAQARTRLYCAPAAPSVPAHIAQGAMA